MSDNTCDHVCPECAAGKHRNCDGLAWCFTADRQVECACLTCEWGQPA